MLVEFGARTAFPVPQLVNLTGSWIPSPNRTLRSRLRSTLPESISRRFHYITYVENSEDRRRREETPWSRH